MNRTMRSKTGLKILPAILVVTFFGFGSKVFAQCLDGNCSNRPEVRPPLLNPHQNPDNNPNNNVPIVDIIIT